MKYPILLIPNKEVIHILPKYSYVVFYSFSLNIYDFIDDNLCSNITLRNNFNSFKFVDIELLINIFFNILS